MRTLGLDVGTKTIGVAVSDPMGWTAQPITTLYRAGFQKDFEEIEKIIFEKEAKVCVIGLPLNMNGTEGPQAQFVRDFVKKFEARFPTISIVMRDERLSTAGAERSLLEADLSRDKRKKVINQMAAVFILQGYLDEQALSTTHGAGDDFDD